MDLAEKQGFARSVGQFVADQVRQATEPLLAQIAELKAELAGLKAFDPAEAIAHAVRAALAEAVAALPAPKDGADCDMDAVARMVGEQVAEAVAALPPAEPGKDADPEVVRALVDAAVAQLPAPAPGKDADPEAIRAMVAEAVAALPPAEPGKDADPEVVRALVDGAVAEAVADAVAALPPAEPGKDCDMEAVARMVGEQVAEAVAALPPAAPGKDCDMEAVLREVGERVAAAVEALPKAKDGVGLAGAVINRDGELVVTLSDGSMTALGRVVGKDGDPGEPGAPGRDGFSLDSFDTEVRDGGRTLVLKFVAGDVTEIHELGLDVMLYRGVFKEGREGGYERGDTVTFGGSLWHCNEPTSEKPGEGKAWTLAAKRGRDGNDGKMVGDPAPRGPINLGGGSKTGGEVG